MVGKACQWEDVTEVVHIRKDQGSNEIFRCCSRELDFHHLLGRCSPWTRHCQLATRHLNPSRWGCIRSEPQQTPAQALLQSTSCHGLLVSLELGSSSFFGFCGSWAPEPPSLEDLEFCPSLLTLPCLPGQAPHAFGFLPTGVVRKLSFGPTAVAPERQEG